MSGEHYTKRYAGGFQDSPSTSTPIDSDFLNAVEQALLYLLGADPLDKGVEVWDAALDRFKTALIVNANIDPAAAIDKSKLAALAIVDADISSGAAIAATKLASGIPASKLNGYPNDVTKRLAGDGSWQTAGSLTSYHQQFDILNSNAETTIFTQVIAGNTIGTNGSLLILIEGDWFNSTTTCTLEIKVKFGATTLWDSTTQGLPTSAIHAPFWLHALLANENSASVQRLAGRATIGPRAAATSGVGTWASSDLASVTFGGSSGLDTTSAQTLAITATLGTAGAANEFKGSVHVLLVP